MRQTVHPTLGTLARMNVLLFFLLCVFVSCIGTAFGFAFGMFCGVIMLLTTDIKDKNIETVIVLTFTVIGFVIPVIALVRGRSKQLRKALELRVDATDNNSPLNVVASSRIDLSKQDTLPLSSNTPSPPPPLRREMIRPVELRREEIRENVEWHYELRGKRRGPVSAEAIHAMIKDRILDSETLVWKRGLREWTRIEDTDLRNYIKYDTPPPLPNGEGQDSVIKTIFGIVVAISTAMFLIFRALLVSMRNMIP